MPKLEQNQTKKKKKPNPQKMISLERMFQSIKTYNQKIHTYPNISENLNITNYTKWCNEIK